jgi:phosphoribosylanthranilate isomerase
VTRVKVCGITRFEDAELATSLGAWALGFILWPGSSRAADPGVAAGIAAAVRRRVQLVGVFVNPTLDEVARAAETLHLTHVQLHGDEGPAFCAEAGRRSGCRVIKAVRVASGADLQDLQRFHTDFHLLDAAAPGKRGGTGTAWDWALAAQRRSDVPVILSGGLTPETVAEGIAMVRPYAVDVASGVEASPGVKDPAKLAAFLAAAAQDEAPTAAPDEPPAAAQDEAPAAQDEAPTAAPDEAPAAAPDEAPAEVGS